MRRRPRRAGLALMMVAVYSATTLGAWSLAARQVSALVRIKGTLKAREAAALSDPDRCRLRALAYGLALLETGLPPIDPGDDEPYRCNVAIGLPDDATVTYTLSFDPPGEDEEHWTVAAELATDLDLPGPGGFVGPTAP